MNQMRVRDLFFPAGEDVRELVREAFCVNSTANLSSGDGAVEEDRAAGGGVGLRQVEGPAAAGEALPQGPGQGAEVLPGGGLEIQHGAEEAPAEALPLQGGGQGLRVRKGRGLPVAEEQEAALGA